MVVTEELYGVDVFKDISTAPYFSITVNGDKGLPLSDNQVAFIREVCARNLTETQITAYATDIGETTMGWWANWSVGMKELRYHYQRGADTFLETGFILRRALVGIISSKMQATFEGINQRATSGWEFNTAMQDLIKALPVGEWIYKPPQATHLGRGRWRVDQEWHWAEQWSVAYGGTWGAL